MFRQNKQLRGFYASKTRSLEQAAYAADQIAAAEHLPITAAPSNDREKWHRENILKMAAVYGTRDRRSERVPASAHLDGDHAKDASGEWSKLEVKGADFQRYLDWLHSIW